MVGRPFVSLEERRIPANFQCEGGLHRLLAAAGVAERAEEEEELHVTSGSIPLLFRLAKNSGGEEKVRTSCVFKSKIRQLARIRTPFILLLLVDEVNIGSTPQWQIEPVIVYCTVERNEKVDCKSCSR